MSDDPRDLTIDEPVRAPVEFRNAALDHVDYAQRIITVIAAPYEEPAAVEYRGELWNEIFERTAWLGIEKRPNRVRANRDHNRSRTVGKAVKFYPTREEGLVAEIRIAQTPLGDETLALADEDCLSTSVGFAARPSDQHLDRRTMTRRISKAFLDHLAFVESPAYIGAEVLSVRGESDVWMPPPPRVATPALDQAIHDDVMRWAAERLNK